MSGSLVVLGIDIGSSSVRASLFDNTGQQTGVCSQRAYQFQATPEGEATIDIRSLLELVCSVIDEVIGAVPTQLDIAAVGLSTFWHSLIGVDGQIRPTTPLMSWADRRCADHARKLRGSWQAYGLQRETGCPAHSSFWPARLTWLAASDAKVFLTTRYWLCAADYLFHEFFGDLRTSMSMASGTGLFELNRLRWSAAALDIAGIDRSSLPNVSDDASRGLCRGYAHRWPRLAHIPWFPAVGDGACSNIGAGCTDQHSMVLMLGTSGSMRILWEASEAHFADPALWCYRADEKRYAGGMALSEGGASAAWARRLLGERPQWDIENEIARMAPDAHRLTVLPYLLGARSPDWIEGRTAAIAGITTATNPIDIYRAMLESVGLRFALLKRRLDQAWPGKRRIVATGAALLHSPAWVQIVADCVGQDVAVSAVDEGSLRGAALLALERMGHSPSFEAFDFPVRAIAKPNDAAHAAYLEAMERQARFDGLLRSGMED